LYFKIIGYFFTVNFLENWIWNFSSTKIEVEDVVLLFIWSLTEVYNKAIKLKIKDKGLRAHKTLEEKKISNEL